MQPKPAEFQEAFDSAVAKYGLDVWLRLHPRERTAAIYAEMRRIDAERFGTLEFEPSARPPRFRPMAEPGAADRRPAADNAVPGNAIPDRAVPDRTVPDRAVPDRAIPGRAVPGRAVPGRAIPERVACDRLFGNR